MTDLGPGERWHFDDRQSEVEFDDACVRDFVALVGKDLADGQEFSVVVSSDEAVRRANGQFRQVTETTDVLSFPDGEDGHLGDILISAARAAQQAAEYGHSVEREIQTLVLHGMLHLNGYDHETDEGQMRRAEEALRVQYGLPSGLIARVDE